MSRIFFSLLFCCTQDVFIYRRATPFAIKPGFSTFIVLYSIDSKELQKPRLEQLKPI